MRCNAYNSELVFDFYFTEIAQDNPFSRLALRYKSQNKSKTGSWKDLAIFFYDHGNKWQVVYVDNDVEIGDLGKDFEGQFSKTVTDFIEFAADDYKKNYIPH